MTTFRDEVGTWFFVMFVSLLAGKVWQWISESRVEALEQQPPTNPRLFHARLIISLAISEAFDLLMLSYCVNTLLEQPRPGMMVMFAFEFAVLAISSTSTAAKYILSLIEAQVVKQQTTARVLERREELRLEREEATRRAGEDTTTTAPADEEVNEEDIDVPGWQEKGRWLLFLDLLTGKHVDSRGSSMSANCGRPSQTRRLHVLLFHSYHVPRHSYSHHPRCLPHRPLLCQTNYRLPQIP